LIEDCTRAIGFTRLTLEVLLLNAWTVAALGLFAILAFRFIEEPLRRRLTLRFGRLRPATA